MRAEKPSSDAQSDQLPILISASRRTDIPAFFADWLFERLREGFVLVENPLNPRQVRCIDLSPARVAGFVFWSKNPQPMLHRLNQLRDYAYYFQYTLNAFGETIEPHVPPQASAVETFRRLADRLGPERVLWRYDPVLLSADLDIDRHLQHFAELARHLRDSTRHCTISFVDVYRKNAAAMHRLGLAPPDPEQVRILAAGFADICRTWGLKLETCAESTDLGDLGIGHACCVDAARIAGISGQSVPAGKNRSQRQACNCSASVDIGRYNSCRYGCVYCYAIWHPVQRSMK